MVGIVIVSHSAKVAEGICDLAGQMARADQKILAAGGMADGSIGTDAVRVSEAIQAAWSDDGVLVLVDLGSAVLSTDMALELLDESMRAKVRVADAPILEGAISAVVEASVGSLLEQVLATAEGAREMRKIL
ncbi:PTS-dependent dihydroxyacetone kinase phosphotransferase subunit DhaM [Heliobacterium gestii]|uniref:phosphoenolpyruvate--glycerone phosphotransferase n=1 Tax=Heliomicrobium gestii TaxID=2699 RepID=A0A845LBL2_HELGE|nr:dihydroxyacetone kinase phosphoryl donor subunit DhaM [Heliomicrobium gestii]MBM7866243.1 dihydroxyacetone kinase phosphotransfer subunit [Heliomicrobium gestii]MZP42961.1 PTS-dependent dihydroxyacetone kinase phosphotransferase subunit DhaM [Heliomicrobium gestii]